VQPALECASLTAPERSRRSQTQAHALRSCNQGYKRVTRAAGALHYLDKTPTYRWLWAGMATICRWLPCHGKLITALPQLHAHSQRCFIKPLAHWRQTPGLDAPLQLTDSPKNKQMHPCGGHSVAAAVALGSPAATHSAHSKRSHSSLPPKTLVPLQRRIQNDELPSARQTPFSVCSISIT
jgi:hypothetical protein